MKRHTLIALIYYLHTHVSWRIGIEEPVEVHYSFYASGILFWLPSEVG